MIILLIGWVTLGIIIAIISILMYYFNILGPIGFIVILLLGILIAVITSIQTILWQKERKKSGISDIESFKNILIVFIIIGVIIFMLGASGYLFRILGIYNFDYQMTNTLSTFLMVGILNAIGGILSWIYIERNTPDAISSEISKQIYILRKIEAENEDIGRNIRLRIRDVTELTESARKTMERNKEELDR